MERDTGTPGMHLAAYRSIIAERLAFSPFVASKFLLEHNSRYPNSVWSSELDFPEDNFSKRVQNLEFCEHLTNLARLQLSEVMNRQQPRLKELFNDNVKLHFVQLEVDLESYEKHYVVVRHVLRSAIKTGEMYENEFTDLANSESLMLRSIHALIKLIDILKPTKENLDVQDKTLDGIIYAFHVTNGYLDSLVSRFQLATGDIRDQLNSIMSETVKEKSSPKESPLLDSMSMELVISKHNLNVILEWLLDMSKRFSVLKREYEAMLFRGVWQAASVNSMVVNNVAPTKIRRLIDGFQDPSFLIDTDSGKFMNLAWILLFVNYLLNFAIEIQYHGMVIFKEFSQRCSSELERGSKDVMLWNFKLPESEFTDETGFLKDNLTDRINAYYRLIVRACYVISTSWHFDPIRSDYRDKVWEEESKLVSETYAKSTAETNVVEVRAGITFRVKRSNIVEAGLGLFLDQDLNEVSDPQFKTKFSSGEFGVPLLVYDGNFMSEEESKILYGGSDSLRPYSVGTAAGIDLELDAYNASTSDISRFINDSFNRLPELGLEPDTENRDVAKRTFLYTTYFLWCQVPETAGKSKKTDSNDPFAANEAILNSLRKISDRNLKSNHAYKTGYSLVVYTMPLSKLPSSQPSSLFKKGQEIWIKYGYDYIKRIASLVRSNNVNYTYQELGSFVHSRRSQIDVTIQENIQKFLQCDTFNKASTDKEVARATLERMLVVSNMLSSRPFNNTENYYTYALEQISKCCMRDITKSALEWVQTVKESHTSETVDYVHTLLKNRIFGEKKVRRDMNGLLRDVPMDCVVAVLISICSCYYACIIQLIDNAVNIKPEQKEYMVEEDDCEDFIKRSLDMGDLRIPGLEQVKINMDSYIELLKVTAISWHVKQQVLFDADQWIDLFKTFRKDLDYMIDRLKLDGVSFESYQKTKDYIDKMELGQHGLGNVAFIANTMQRAASSADPLDYIEDVDWLMDIFKTSPEMKGLISRLFSKETIEFKQRIDSRMKSVVQAMKRQKKLENLGLIVDFGSPTLDATKLAQKDVAAVLATAHAYVKYDAENNTLKPLTRFDNVQFVLNAIGGNNKDLFYPRWVYETESEETGKKLLLSEYKRRTEPMEEEPAQCKMPEPTNREPMEYSESNKKRVEAPVVQETEIFLEYKLDLNLKKGPRFRGDNFPRHGFAAELFVSREFGPNFQSVEVPLVLESDGSVKKSQVLQTKFKLIQDQEVLVPIDEEGVFVPRRVRSKYASVGVYIRGLVKPFDAGRVLSEKTRLDYEGECYVPLMDKHLIGRRIPILCKTFQVEKDYEVIGHLTVLKSHVHMDTETKFEGEYSESHIKSVEALAEGIINGFFDKINSKELGYHPQEPHLRNKHTPIWPNTPLSKLPSSLFVLNVPVGQHAYNGFRNFEKCLSILGNAYDIGVETDLKSSLQRICNRRVAEGKPENTLIMELYAVTRLIAESIALIPDICDYKSDFARDGTIGENYGEGTNGIDDCESLAKLGYSIGYALKQMSFEEGTVMYYIQKILYSYVEGLVGCASSRPASGGGESGSSNQGKRNLTYINHVFAALIPFKNFLEMCERCDKKFNKMAMQKYRLSRGVGEWYDDYLQPLVVEGTGNTLPLMTTCEKLIDDAQVKNCYVEWAKKFLGSNYKIYGKFKKLAQLGFQDSSALKFIENEPKDKSRFSEFYADAVHFFTPDLVNNNGPLVTDLMFCRRGEKSQGSTTEWVYGVNFYDFVHKSRDVCLYPAIEFTKEQFLELSSIATTQVYPPNIPPVLPESDFRLLDEFVRKDKQIGKSVLSEFTKNKVIGILSQKQIVAYTNHLELYADKRVEIKELVEGGWTDIVKCEVFGCTINDKADMVQFVFHLQ